MKVCEREIYKMKGMRDAGTKRDNESKEDRRGVNVFEYTCSDVENQP